MLATLTQPALSMAERGLGAIGLPLASVGMGAGGGPPGPSVGDRHWQRMAQQSLAWLQILTAPAGRTAFQRAKEYSVMGKTKPILWRPFQVSGHWFATARAKPTDPPILFAFGAMAGGHKPGSSPTDLGAVPGSAVNNALQPTIHLDDHGVATLKSLMGIGAGDSVAVLNANLRRWAQLPVQPAPDSPNWKDLSSADLGLLNGEAGWSAAVSNANKMGETEFRYRGSWYMKSALSPSGFKVLGGGSGSGGHRYMAGAGVGQVKPNFKPVTQADLNTTAAGADLLSAAGALNAYIAANGVPDEHVYNAVVYQFQVAYNADQVSDIENDSANNGKLNEDGEYGPNTQAAYGAILGVQAPAPKTTPVTVTPTTPTTVVVTSGTNYTVPIVAGLLVVAAGGVGYAAYRRKKTHPHMKHAHA